MAATRLRFGSATIRGPQAHPRSRLHAARQQLSIPRQFSSTANRFEQRDPRKDSFRYRLRYALDKTEIKWYPIPVGLGIGFLGFLQFYKSQQREKRRLQEENGGEGGGEPGKPKKRERIRPSGPWYGAIGARRVNARELTSTQAGPNHVDASTQGDITSLGKI